MLGLDNAATPMGLKAMKELQELNPKKPRHQSDGHVPCTQHFRTDTYPRQHHDVPLADGCRPTHGHLYPPH